MLLRPQENLSCDVLVIGGGGAGLRSAIAARLRHADVLIAAKSPFITNTYDAAAVLGLAAYAARIKGVPVNARNIRDHLRQVSNPPGTFVGPGDFDLAFSLLKAGKPINYEGASGAVDFDEDGDVTAPIEVWRFSGGNIRTYRMEYQASE